ncbi:T9SS type A sorting domain-containing protein, partial [Chitinophagales bacterium]|nr:T9SS type A sorting domain-containing protein [Chitinophagales bacterium]
GGPYPNQSELLYTNNICVEIGTELTFLIEDANGDGICCGNSGDGFYNLSLFDQLIATGGAFGEQGIENFTVAAPAENGANLQNLGLGLFQPIGLKTIPMTIQNIGSQPISSIEINWTDGSDTGAATITGISIPAGETDVIQHPVSWLVSLGESTITATVLAVNGDTGFESANPISSRQVSGALESAQRVPMIEHFTDVSSLPDAAQNPDFWDQVGSVNTPLSVISYHKLPVTGSDPFYDFNPADNSARVGFYGASGTVQAFLQGNIGPVAANEIVNVNMLAAIADSQGPWGITLSETMDAGTATITAEFEAFIATNNPNLRAFVAVVERSISLDVPAGSNGETDFDYVLRGFATSNQGEAMTAEVGTPMVLNLNYEIPAGVDASNLRTVVFVQNVATKAIAQSLTGDTATGSAELKNTSIEIISVTESLCGDGAVDASGIVNPAGISYNWTDSEDKIVGTGPIVTTTEPGVYTLELSFGDQAESFDFTVGGSAAPVVTVSDVVMDDGTANGSATVSATGNNGPYDVTWPDGTVGGTLGMLAAGPYDVSISDANGCVFTETVVISLAGGINDGAVVVEKIYPNPASGAIHLELTFEQVERYQIQLISLDGQLSQVVANGVSTPGKQLISADLNGIPAGYFVLHLQTESGQASYPIIVQE